MTVLVRHFRVASLVGAGYAMYEPVRYRRSELLNIDRLPAAEGVGRVMGPSAAEVVDDHVAQHRAVALAQLRGGWVAAEDRAERMSVGHAEDAEGTDHQVEIEGVHLAPERRVSVPALEDPIDDRDGRAVLPDEALQAGDVLCSVDVLDCHEASEIGM